MRNTPDSVDEVEIGQGLESNRSRRSVMPGGNASLYPLSSAFSSTGTFSAGFGPALSSSFASVRCPLLRILAGVILRPETLPCHPDYIIHQGFQGLVAKYSLVGPCSQSRPTGAGLSHLMAGLALPNCVLSQRDLISWSGAD